MTTPQESNQNYNPLRKSNKTLTMAAVQNGNAMKQVFQRLGLSVKASDFFVNDQKLDNLNNIKDLEPNDIVELCKLCSKPGGMIANPNIPTDAAALPVRVRYSTWANKSPGKRNSTWSSSTSSYSITQIHQGLLHTRRSLQQLYFVFATSRRNTTNMSIPYQLKYQNWLLGKFRILHQFSRLPPRTPRCDAGTFVILRHHNGSTRPRSTWTRFWRTIITI